MSSTIGTVIIDVKADTAKLVDGMDKAEKTVKQTVGSMKKAILSMVAAYAGIESIRGFTGMITDSIDAADAAGKLAKKLGLTTNTITEYHYAASMAGIANGELNAGLGALIRRLNNFQENGGGAAKDGFESLGISAEYARKNFTSIDIAFEEILKRLEQMPDGYKKTAIAQDIFSKSASGMLNLTATDLKNLSEEARKIGLSVSADVSNMSAEYNDQMDKLGYRITGISNQLATEFLPAITESATQFDKILNGSSKYMADVDFLMATTSRTVDVFNLLYETAENTVQTILYSLNTAVYGFASGVTKMALGLSESLNSIGVLSDKELEQNRKLSQWLESEYNVAKRGIIDSGDEIEEAYRKFNTPIEERIALYREERAELVKNSKLAKSINNNSSASGSGDDKTFTAAQIALTKKQIALQTQLEYDATAARWDYEEERIEQAHELKMEKDKEWMKSLKEFYAYDPDFDSKEISQNFFNGWTDVVTNTFVDGIQDAMDGSYDFASLTKGFAESFSSALMETGVNNLVTNAADGTTTSDSLSGDWSSIIIGAALAGITNQLDRYDKTHSELGLAIDNLATATENLASMVTGDGTAISNTFTSRSTLEENLANARVAEGSFTQDDLQKLTDAGYTLDARANFDNTLSTSGLGMLTNDFTTELFDGLRNEGEKTSGSKEEEERLRKDVVEAELALTNWTISIIDSAEALNDYSKKFGDMYDQLTGSSFFSDERGLEAYTKVTSSFGMSLEDLTYTLANQFNISDITQFKKDLAGDKNSQAYEDAFAISTDMLNELGIDAVDAIDDISLAVDYMVDTTSDATSAISDIASAIDTLSGTSSALVQNNLAQFNSDMAMALQLKDTPFDESFQEYLQKAIDGSSTLLDSDNFSSLVEQQYAQALAINDFESMSDGVESQIDVLKDIRVNTNNIDENADKTIVIAEQTSSAQISAAFDIGRAIEDPIYAAVASILLISEWLTDGFQGMEGGFTDGWKGLEDSFTDSFDVLGSSFTNDAGNIISTTSFWSNKLMSSFSDSFDGLESGFTDGWEGLEEVFAEIDLVEGVGDAFDKSLEIFTAPLATLNSVLEGLADFLDIKLPSIPTVDEVTDMVTEVGQGIEDSTTDVIDTIVNIVDSVDDYVEEVFSVPLPSRPPVFIPTTSSNDDDDDIWDALNPITYIPPAYRPPDPFNLYESGGYTGDSGISEVAGIVHGQEYVVNAQTTRDLGLNGSGGVFREMLKILEKSHKEQQEQNKLIEAQANEIRTLRKETQDQTDYLALIEEKTA